MGMRHPEEEAASQHGTYRIEDMKTDARGQVTVEGVYHPLGGYSNPFLGLRRHLPDRVQPSSYPSRLSVEDPLRRLDSPSGGCSGNAPHQQIGAGGDGHRPNLKPQPFDGSKPLADYLSHFEVVAALNRWGDSQKSMSLVASLSGPAQRLLHWVDIYSPNGYQQLLAVLQERYAPRHQEELHRATLKTQRQRKGETLRSLADDIEIGIEKAYPQADRTTMEQLSKEYFVGAIYDPRLRQWEHIQGPMTLRDAVALALQAQAYFQGEDLRTPHRARMVANEARPMELDPENAFGDYEQVAAMQTRSTLAAVNQGNRTTHGSSLGVTKEEVSQLIRDALEDWANRTRPRFGLLG